jgi:hypothetical protein
MHLSLDDPHAAPLGNFEKREKEIVSDGALSAQSNCGTVGNPRYGGNREDYGGVLRAVGALVLRDDLLRES